jgi:hypothetical protein
MPTAKAAACRVKIGRKNKGDKRYSHVARKKQNVGRLGEKGTWNSANRLAKKRANESLETATTS